MYNTVILSWVYNTVMINRHLRFYVWNLSGKGITSWFSSQEAPIGRFVYPYSLPFSTINLYDWSLLLCAHRQYCSGIHEHRKRVVRSVAQSPCPFGGGRKTFTDIFCLMPLVKPLVTCNPIFAVKFFKTFFTKNETAMGKRIVPSANTQ